MVEESKRSCSLSLTSGIGGDTKRWRRARGRVHLVQLVVLVQTLSGGGEQEVVFT